MLSEFLQKCYAGIRLQEFSVPKALEHGANVDASVLQSAKLVAFTGCGDSYAVSHFGRWALILNDIGAIAVSPPELKLIRSLKSWVTIGVSASGRSLSTISALKYAFENGSYTIALTDNTGGPITDVADDVWCTKSEISTYDIIPTASTTSALAFLLGITKTIANTDKYDTNPQQIKQKMKKLMRWAENRGKELSKLMIGQDVLFFIADGANFTAAMIGMMKVNEASLTKGIAILREEFQHYANLSVQEGEPLILISDSSTNNLDQDFLKIVREKLHLSVEHLYVPGFFELEHPLVQAIMNSIVLQFGAFYALVETNPKKDWFRRPHAEAFRIY